MKVCRESYGVIKQKKLIPGGDRVAVCKDNRLVLTLGVLGGDLAVLFS